MYMLYVLITSIHVRIHFIEELSSKSVPKYVLGLQELTCDALLVHVRRPTMASHREPKFLIF